MDFPTDLTKAAPLLQFFFVCMSVVLYVAVVLSLFVWKQKNILKIENGSLGLLRRFISSNEVCNTAYAL